MTTKVRHILSLSGGKDSTALALYLRDKVPELEYVFCDTEKELPETYEYLDRIEAHLGVRIVRLKHDGRDFDHHLKNRHGFLPSPLNRWCTEHLKLRPFEHYVRSDEVVNYVGLRADEMREGYISHKPNIRAAYPLRDAGMILDDVKRILEDAGLGLPPYSEWRSRSGCYFCFFQQKWEWVGLLEKHPDLFAKAMDYERWQPSEEKPYTWSQGETLEHLSLPERVAEIKAEHDRKLQRLAALQCDRPLMEVVASLPDDEVGRACLICDL
ncbi:MAG TPA: phosphoadenosine phosphosulfate reductase family protein [Anaerolineae bacterium]|nr:phosphoadenosine phosphosulfate reductase family protein [Anaerolineae bacterium]